jgi:hypothetical protein
MDMIGDISHHLSPVCTPSFTQQTAGNSGSGDAQQGNPGYGVLDKIARRDPDAAKIRALIGLELMQEVAG